LLYIVKRNKRSKREAKGTEGYGTFFQVRLTKKEQEHEEELPREERFLVK
jgi:hypothetical protein